MSLLPFTVTAVNEKEFRVNADGMSYGRKLFLKAVVI